jgi:hypothetical protein
MRIRMFAPIAALLLGGCGLISKDLEGNVKFDFTINDMMSHYSNTVVFDPNSNEDVKNNRDSIEGGSILEITLELLEILPGNEAKMVAGQVDVRPSGAGEDAWIMAVGQWSGIPLYIDDISNQPAIGQVFKIDLPLDKINDLSNLVFKQENAIDFRLNGYGYDWYLQEKGPVALRGEVDVHLSVTVAP